MSAAVFQLGRAVVQGWPEMPATHLADDTLDANNFTGTRRRSIGTPLNSVSCMRLMYWCILLLFSRCSSLTRQQRVRSPLTSLKSLAPPMPLRGKCKSGGFVTPWHGVIAPPPPPPPVWCNPPPRTLTLSWRMLNTGQMLNIGHSVCSADGPIQNQIP